MATWVISEMERDATTGGVTVAHWRVEEVSGEYSASAYGTCGFEPDADADDFIAYDSLTEDVVLGWVHAEVDQAETEAALTANIAEQQTPATLTGKPW